MQSSWYVKLSVLQCETLKMSQVAVYPFLYQWMRSYQSSTDSLLHTRSLLTYSHTVCVWKKDKIADNGLIFFQNWFFEIDWQWVSTKFRILESYSTISFHNDYIYLLSFTEFCMEKGVRCQYLNYTINILEFTMQRAELNNFSHIRSRNILRQ